MLRYQAPPITQVISTVPPQHVCVSVLYHAQDGVITGAYRDCHPHVTAHCMVVVNVTCTKTIPIFIHCFVMSNLCTRCCHFFCVDDLKFVQFFDQINYELKIISLEPVVCELVFENCLLCGGNLLTQVASHFQPNSVACHMLSSLFVFLHCCHGN